MLCEIFFDYILDYVLGYSLGIKPYVGAKFCVVLLSQRYSLAVRDFGPPAASECSPGERPLSSDFEEFPRPSVFPFVKA